MTYELVIRNATCVLPAPNDQHRLERVDIGINEGRIAHIGSIPLEATQRNLNAKGLTVLPGVIDSQVHFREPGPTHKEDLASGTLSAVLGGVTAVFEMPNTRPPTASAIDLNDKMERAKGRTWCDYGFFIGATTQNADRLGQLEYLPGCCGVKVFVGSSTGDLLVESDEWIQRVLEHTQRRVTFHSEDEFRLKERKHILEHKPTVHMHPEWRDELTAITATKRILKLARDLKHPVHILHVTTAEEMEILGSNKDLATVEVTPQHLSFFAPDCYDKLGTFAQMNPPIRSKRHQEALWKALQTGIVDVIGTDHAPHTREEKAQPYPTSPSGMTGVQTLVPIMLNHVHQGRLSLERLVELICRNPARISGLVNKGSITVGNDADFTLVDLKKEMTLTHEIMASKSGWTPYDGEKVTGWPVATIVRGRVVMRDAQVLDKPSGAPCVFKAGN